MRHEAFEHFFDEGLVEAHLKPLKHGKEASVHLFRANPRTTGEELVAQPLALLPVAEALEHHHERVALGDRPVPVDDEIQR